MGIQTMGSQGGGQHSHLQPLSRQSSWYSLTLGEVENQLGNLVKPLGSMNLDELVKNAMSVEPNTSTGMNFESTSSLRRQASLSLVKAPRDRTVEEVWREIQLGKRIKKEEDGKSYEREETLGEMTLEDFLAKAGVFAKHSSSAPLGLGRVDTVIPRNLSHQLSLFSSPSIGTLTDTSIVEPERNYSGDALGRTVERRLRRKIKNRESAARSRARKLAYHNELVIKVSRLEEENLKLKKEKDLDSMLQCELSTEPRYQLRRTSSASLLHDPL